MDISNARGEDEKIIALLQSIEAKSGLAEVTLPPELQVTANVEFPPTMPVTGTVAISGTVPVSISGVDGGSGTLPVSLAAPVAISGTVPVSLAGTLPVSLADPVAISGTVPVSIAGVVATSGSITIESVTHHMVTVAAGAGYTALPSVAGKGYVSIVSWNGAILRASRNGGTSYQLIFDALPYSEPFVVNSNELSLRRDDAGAQITVTVTIVKFA